jgi:hypothetical protein
MYIPSFTKIGSGIQIGVDGEDGGRNVGVDDCKRKGEMARCPLSSHSAPQAVTRNKQTIGVREILF